MDADDDRETAPVRVTLTGIQKVHGREPLVALAVAELDIGGVILLLQGIQIRRNHAGRMDVLAPQFKSNTGEWFPAVTLPAVILSALEDAFVEASDPRRRGRWHGMTLPAVTARVLLDSDVGVPAYANAHVSADQRAGQILSFIANHCANRWWLKELQFAGVDVYNVGSGGNGEPGADAAWWFCR